MTQQDKGKNIFQAAMNAVSGRDEKAAIEAAMKRAEELEQRVEQAEQKMAQNGIKLATAEKQVTQLTADLTKAKADLAKAQADLAKVQTELDAARTDANGQRSRAAAAEQRLAAANQVLQKNALAGQAKEAAEAAEAAEKAKIIAEHTLKPDESLSHLALKYYGSAYEPYWRVIYEANKEVIGDNPGRVRPGTVLKIPVLPEELKKK